jgi:class 3 adenylate cyclase
MFLDIRDFTSLSEKMSPRENFLFLNSYYERVCPVIRDYKGFIDKYLGDGIMALFAGKDSPENAVQAAIEMRAVLNIYNTHRNNTGYDSIRIGIGIHTGTLMMGTIGEEKRMDGTVISDAVNLCSRIESLTKEYGLNVAISDETYKRLNQKNRKLSRFIGKITVKGKQIPVSIYEIFSGDPTEKLIKKMETKETFEKAVRLRDAGNYEESYKEFKEVFSRFPEDETTKIYLARFRKSDS